MEACAAHRRRDKALRSVAIYSAKGVGSGEGQMCICIYLCVLGYNSVRAAITPPVYDRVTARPCDMPQKPMQKAPCDGRQNECRAVRGTRRQTPGASQA